MSKRAPSDEPEGGADRRRVVAARRRPAAAAERLRAVDAADVDAFLLPELLRLISTLLPPDAVQIMQANRHTQEAWFARVEKLSPHAWLLLKSCRDAKRFYALRTMVVRAGLVPEDLDDECLANFKRLEVLHLEGGSRSRLDAAGIGALVNLTSLSVKSVFMMSDAPIAQLTKLRHLSLDSVLKFTGAGLEPLHALEGLTLKMCPNVIGTRLYDNLEMARNLVALSIDRVHNIPDAEVAKFTGLTALALRNTNHTSAAVAGLTRLRTLCVSGSALIDDAALRRLTALTELDIGVPADAPHNAITGVGLRTLRNLTSLTVANNDVITADDMAQLTAASLRRLDVEHFDGRPIVGGARLLGAFMPYYGRFTALTELRASYTFISDSHLLRLTMLRVLLINGSDDVSDVSIAQLTLLETLVVGGNPKITNEGLRGLAQLKYLAIVDPVPVTWEVLASLVSLRHLSLDESCNETFPADALHEARALRRVTATLLYYTEQKDEHLAELVSSGIRLFEDDIVTRTNVEYSDTMIDVNPMFQDEAKPWFPYGMR